jgi:hypothetical protein
MDSLGLILAILGGVVAFASALGLAFSRGERDNSSAFQWADAFLLVGVVSFILGFSRGISDAFRDRTSSSFLLTVVFVISMSVTSIGIWLI